MFKVDTMKRTAEETKATVKKQQNKVKDGARAEEPYSVQLNGVNGVGNVSKAPPWPRPQLKNERMFVLPKQLESEDQITVKMEALDQPGMLRVGLVTGFNSPDYSNLACQLEMTFPPQYSDNLTITTVQNGQATNLFNEKAGDYYEGTYTNVIVTFRMRENGFMDVGLGQSHLYTMRLQHDIQNIRFLTVNGDINRVSGIDFQFGY
ncbi:hypothetical protein PYW08_001502 [Mythimna loreyi]|uniref:Uncharacterized protein n=1 Tax=Mythimna loreyi TaxID=667449 RepID=A0ACC2R4P8_9NEOP|nr:hypothetical protein PYW08_001502 [Mythimna loreyi]